jgi:long-chain fatty acid transport protein
LVLAFAFSEHSWATGFFINQQSVRGLGRVDAGSTVAADELGTIFFNPAGLTRVVRDWQDGEHIRISLATHLIMPRSDQRSRTSVAATPGTLGAPVPVGGGDAQNPTGATPVLNGYVGRALLNNRGAIGLGFNSPFGLATRFEPDWHGRYDATEASLLTLNFSLVAAYRFDSGVSVGGGLDLQHARTLLATAIPDPVAPGGPTAATDGAIRTEGHNTLTPGFNVGLMYDINDRTRVGVHHRSGMKHEISGTSAITGLHGPLASFNGTVDADAEINLPAITAAGLRSEVAEQLVLLGEFAWFDWSTFREVRIRFADGRPDGVRTSNFRDAYSAAIGAEYPVNPAWTARGGLRYDTTPTVDGFRDTTVPDSERLWLGLGTSFEMSGRLNLDLAFNHVFFRDTAVDVTRTFFDNTPLPTAVRVNSDVSTVVNTIAVDLRFTF